MRSNMYPWPSARLRLGLEEHLDIFEGNRPAQNGTEWLNDMLGLSVGSDGFVDKHGSQIRQRRPCCKSINRVGVKSLYTI